MRAWIHAEENKRRTLQRSDIASALAKSDMFDFLIDIVPREEAASHAKRATAGASVPTGTQLPPATQHVQSHQGHNAMPPPDYGALSGGHGINPTDDYRGSMYAAQVQPGPPAYGAAPGQQMYSEMEGIYGYPPMQAQQVCSELKAMVSFLRSQPPSSSPRSLFDPPTSNSHDPSLPPPCQPHLHGGKANTPQADVPRPATTPTRPLSRPRLRLRPSTPRRRRRRR